MLKVLRCLWKRKKRNTDTFPAKIWKLKPTVLIKLT